MLQISRSHLGTVVYTYYRDSVFSGNDRQVRFRPETVEDESSGNPTPPCPPVSRVKIERHQTGAYCNIMTGWICGVIFSTTTTVIVSAMAGKSSVGRGPRFIIPSAIRIPEADIK